MKKTLFLFCAVCFSAYMQASVSKTVNVTTSGTLTSYFTTTERSTVTDLTITGSINAKDFRFMKDTLSALVNLDMSGASIVTYNGTDGTYSDNGYPANQIPTNGFAYKTTLQQVKIPSSVTSIANYVFEGCTGLTSINIPSSVTSLGISCFAGCTSLTSISIPSNVTLIDNGAFAGSATSVVVDVANKNYCAVDGVLFNQSKSKIIHCPITQTSYTIPGTVNIVDSLAFYECVNLASIVIPSSVATIYYSAFNRCSKLTSVSIPSSVTYIGNGAFANCTGLTSITAYGTTPATCVSANKTSTFDGVNTTSCKLHVLSGTETAYAAALGWKDFTIVPDATNGVFDVKSSAVKANVQNGEVKITGVQDGENIAVYNIRGVAVYNGKTSGQSVSVVLPQRGVYIARVGVQSLKLVY